MNAIIRVHSKNGAHILTGCAFNQPAFCSPPGLCAVIALKEKTLNEFLADIKDKTIGSKVPAFLFEKLLHSHLEAQIKTFLNIDGSGCKVKHGIVAVGIFIVIVFFSGCYKEKYYLG